MQTTIIFRRKSLILINKLRSQDCFWCRLSCQEASKLCPSVRVSNGDIQTYMPSAPNHHSTSCAQQATSNTACLHNQHRRRHRYRIESILYYGRRYICLITSLMLDIIYILRFDTRWFSYVFTYPSPTTAFVDFTSARPSACVIRGPESSSRQWQPSKR